jgi:predicted TPR repeat methyltransferase
VPDYLQIALEHHRAGRLTRAQRGYRAILNANPDDAEAAHWLGILFLQAGRADDALPLIEQSVAAVPCDPAYVHNLGQCYLRLGRLSDAISTFDRALQLDPSRTESLISAGLARLGRKMPGDAETAGRLLIKARDADHTDASVHLYLGIALLTSGNVPAAIDSLQTSIGTRDDSADAHYHLGIAWRRNGDSRQARRSFTRAIELDPNSVRAMQALAVIEADEGRLNEAEQLLCQTVELRPDLPAVHQNLAAFLQKTGRPREAELALRQAPQSESRPAADSATAAIARLEDRLSHSPRDATLHFRLAKQFDIAPPAQIPAESVSGLFDRYADLFDEHLVEKLDYQAPGLIAATLAATKPAGPLDILDLGCGTGLCGPLLRPMARRLVGVDLSPAMIDKARERQIYDHLSIGDLIDAMNASPRSFDALVAADVLMYLGDLVPTFEAACDCLRPGGLFVFSVEVGTGNRYQLRKDTHRFCHSKPYLQHLARIYGWVEESITEITVRKEAGHPVKAYLTVLRLPNLP